MNMNVKLLCYLYLGSLSIKQAVSYELVPRWGQATVSINNALFVHGGKTDPYNSYGYTSAPNNNDTLYLSLSSSFDASSPPWQLLNASQAFSSAGSPALSWHTLSTLNATHLLLFGGQPGPNSPTVLTGEADSVYLVDVTNQAPLWTPEPLTWADEPIRRVHHSAATTTSGDVYVIGGEKADDSSIAFSEHYVFNPSIPSFTLLPSDNAPPGITGHASVVLSDGRILVLGGYSQSPGGLLPFSTMWALNTSQSPTWSKISVSDTSLPSPRRAFAATTISGGKVLIHGGSDAEMQNNFADGWVLDPSQDPMVWTQLETLSQLGAQRDHLAVSSGDQVIFCFGYGNDGPSPISLRIYNTDRNAFEASFIPSSSPTPTGSSPSQTSQRPTTTKSVGHGSSIAPTHTGGTGGPNGGSDPHEDSSHNKTAIAVGSTLGVLALVVVALAGTYYYRQHRRRTDRGGHFRALGGSNIIDDDESEHLAGSIPAAGLSQRGHTFGSRHAWDFGVFDAFGLATALTIGTRNTRHAPERKDMLADEDTRDFAPWYDDRQQEGSVDRAWSLKSIIPSLKRSREPSYTGSAGGLSWREKADPFSDAAALMEADHIGTSVPQGRRQQSYTSNRSYHDPFTDPIDEDSRDEHDEEQDHILNQPYLHPIPQQLSTLRTILPVSQGGHPLTPLTEQTSRTTLDGTASSHTMSHHHSPFDTISSITSGTSFDPPKSLLPSSSSSVSATAPMKRSDSWWSRFARTSFLDRRSSDASRRMLNFRDPNPPPRLGAIEERSRTASLVDRQQSGSSDLGRSGGVIRHVSRLQGGHNKSQSSVRTADTEAIERMARTMDVAHLMRSDSRRTASTITTNLSIDTHQSGWLHEERGAGTDPEHTFTSPVEMTNAEGFSHQHDDYHSNTSPGSPVVVPVIDFPNPRPKHAPPASSGAVAARIQTFERHRSDDSEAPPHEQPKGRPNQRANSQSVKYGLVPRASLFVANPDHRTIASDDT
ncbi:hypothetical protein DXG01_007157 [Tephrocybe rancida]|nr:hypothetical protein DXG01_007157 [Tephrocybe rancida]